MWLLNGVRPLLGMVAGLIMCYAFGTAWFVIVYTNTKEPIGILTALTWCVFPFIIPDVIKIILAMALTRKLKRYLMGSDPLKE